MSARRRVQVGLDILAQAANDQDMPQDDNVIEEPVREAIRDAKYREWSKQS